ncbi:MAG: hypothetical protein U0638_02925 [Phycisphaerales bacterium]
MATDTKTIPNTPTTMTARRMNAHGLIRTRIVTRAGLIECRGRPLPVRGTHGCTPGSTPEQIEQIPRRSTIRWHPPIRRNLRERLEHEQPLPQARVGQGQARLIDGVIAEQKKIEIESPASPSRRVGPIAPAFELDAEQMLQQFLRRERRAQVSRAVEIAILISWPNWLGLDDRRNPDQLRARELRERFNRRTDMRMAIAEI